MKPSVVITADGQDVSSTVLGRLISLTLTDCAGDEADCLTLELNNTDELLDPPAEGRLLEVFLGFDGATTSMGQFVVDEVNAQGWPSTVTVQARGTPFSTEGQYQTMHSRKRRSFDLSTLGELVAKIASDAGLQPVVADELASFNIGHVDQADESDIHLLCRLAKDAGGVVKPAFGKLMVLVDGADTTASGSPIPVTTIARAQAVSYSYSRSKREELGSVVAVYRDQAAALENEATWPAEGGEPVERLRFIYRDADAAQAAAKARYGQAQRGCRSLTITVAGDPALQAQSRLALEGFPMALDDEWRVRKVTHTVTPDQGYVCTVEADTTVSLGAGVVAPVGSGEGGGSLDAGGLDPVPPLTPSVP